VFWRSTRVLQTRAIFTPENRRPSPRLAIAV